MRSARRTTRGVAARLLAGVLVVLTGCGIAGETGVTRDHDAARRGPFSGDQAKVEPRKREDSSTPVELVANYLRAVAGDRENAVDRVRKFLLPGVQANWSPKGSEIIVVRQLGNLIPSPKPGGYDVKARLQPVGVLTEHGEVEPLAGEQPVIDTVFEVLQGEAVQSGLYLSKPYDRLLLSTSAFAQVSGGRADAESEALYQPHQLYFWDNQLQTLVPDLRYLPLSMPAAQRPTEVVKRLLAGPSGWLSPVVQAPPAQTEVRGSVVVTGDRMVIDLNAKAVAPGTIPVEKLLAQLRWSLWDWHQGPISLQIEGQEKASDGRPSAYISENVAATVPRIYCIADKVVLVECADPSVETVPILKPEVNSAVEAAAISKRGSATYAALVRATGRSRTLVVGRIGPGDTTPTYVTTGLTASSLSRPVWLNVAETPIKGLIVADGSLYSFDAAGNIAALQTGVDGIQAVAAAPDARRIAFVAGGAVYVAPLSARSNALTVGSARRLETSLKGLTAVAFTRPERLAVAGSGWLAEVSVDGAIEELLHNVGDAKVTNLVAHPGSPQIRSNRGLLLAELNGVAFQVYASRLQQVAWQPPSVSPQPNGPKPPRVTAAFYEG